MNDNRKRKILVMDDESPIAEVISEFCKSFGFETKILTSGENALEAVKGYRPDLITLDLIMPEVSGVEVLEQLKADPETRDIPIIIISSIAGSTSVEEMLKKQTQEILSKPVQLKTLKASIEEALSHPRKKTAH